MESFSENIQLDNIIELFLAENDRLKNAFENISFDHITNNNERIEAENKTKVELLDAWSNNMEKILSPLLSEESVSNKDEIIWEFFQKLLNKVLSDHPNQKKEIVLYRKEKDNDLDIANVFEMLITRETSKNKNYLILPDSLFDRLAKSAPHSNVICNKIDTISYLHHWSTRSMIKYPTEEVDKLIKIITKVPNIDMLVLRGCSTAGNIKDEKVFDPKEISIISANKDIEKAPIKQNEFLFQQKQHIDVVKTFVKYYDQNNKIIVKELPNIPLNKEKNKLSIDIEKALALSSKENQLPLLSFKSKEMEGLIARIRNDWLSNKTISHEDKNIIKASDKHTKTFEVSEFPSDRSFARAIEEKLIKEGRKIPIKSYAIAYTGYKTGAYKVPRYTIKTAPKALKKLKY